MASVSKDGRFQWIGPGKKRNTVWVSEVVKDAHSADTFRRRIAKLQACKTAGEPWSAELAEWVGGLSDDVHSKLAKAGLVKPREAVCVVTLGALRERFDKSLTVRAGTTAAYKQGLDSLCEHFGKDRDIKSITPADADAWRKALVDEKLALATVSKRVQTARNLFRKAIRWKLLSESPLADVVAGKQHNPDRQRFIPAEVINRVIAEARDVEWKLLIALSRYAGLRCPSEHLALTWADWDVERGALVVRAAKTGTVRRVPVTPELLPHLQAAYEAADDGATWMIAKYRQANCNLRTQLLRYIERAGVEAWPRVWHNLRASCGTSWSERFPVASVARWLGHNVDTCAQHYLTARDSDFAAAVGSVSQKPAQSQAEKSGNDRKPGSKHSQESSILPLVSAGCGNTQKEKMGAGGFEPP